VSAADVVSIGPQDHASTVQDLEGPRSRGAGGTGDGAKGESAGGSEGSGSLLALGDVDRPVEGRCKALAAPQRRSRNRHPSEVPSSISPPTEELASIDLEAGMDSKETAGAVPDLVGPTRAPESGQKQG
jgi:hypothetical protein